MAHQASFLSLVFLIYSLNLAASEVYHIKTNSTSADLCTAPCLTFSEFAISLSNYLYSNTTLVFLPGTHYLIVNVSISNTGSFSMTSESITPQTVCKSYQHIHFKHSWYIGISNLEFIGCGGNQVKSMDKFVVKDTVTVFNVLNTSSTALEIIVSVIQIANSTFKFHGSNPS